MLTQPPAVPHQPGAVQTPGRPAPGRTAPSTPRTRLRPAYAEISSQRDQIGKLLGRRSRDEPVTRLTAREREVLALMAEGRSNSAIAQRLSISEKAVSKHSTSIFTKLDLAPSEDDNRRVLAVLAYLNA